MTLAPPVSYTATTGNFLTAALWNAQVRDATAFFSAPPSFRAYATVAQAMGVDNTWYSLTLDTEQFDNYGGHSTSTNTSRYTCQVAGIYQVSAVATFANFSSTVGNRAVRIAVNGNAYPGSFVKTLPAVTGSSAVATSALIQLAVGDYIEVQGNHNSTNASMTTSVAGPDVYPSMSALWVSN